MKRPEVFRPVERLAISQTLRDQLGTDLVLLRTSGSTKPPGTKPTSWLQLAKAGTWSGHSMGEFTFDAKTFGEIASNFAKSLNGRIPLDFEHAAEAGFEGSIAQKGAPAQGWIVELRYTNDALEGKVEWNENQPGMEYVRDGAYMFLSPAVIFDSFDRVTGKAIGAELTSCAMTNRPFLDGLKPLAARHDVSSPTTATARVTKTSGAPMLGHLLSLALTVDDKLVELALPPEFIKNAKKKKKKGTTEPGAKEDDGDGKPFDDEGGDEEGGGEGGGGGGDEGEMKASAKCSYDGRTVTKLAAEEYSYAELTCEICEALNSMFGSWSCYVVAVYDGHVVYSKGDDFYDIAYTMKKGNVKLVGEPQEVRRIYKPITASAVGAVRHAPLGDTETMSKTNEVLGLKAEASEASQLSAINAINENVKALTADNAALKATVKLRDERIASLFSALGLKADAPDAEFAKTITEFSAAKEQLAALEPEIKKFRDERSEFESKVGNSEIDWLVTRGADYGFPGLAKSRVSLEMHRKADAVSFAATYKPALDGMAAGDRPVMFSRVTAPGSALQAPAPVATTPAGGSDANSQFDADVAKEIAEAKANGVKLSVADAMTAVTKRLLAR